MTTLKLRLRLGKGRVLIPDEVDIDHLTPKARAFAEAIHDSPGHQPIGVLCDTGRRKGDSPKWRAVNGYGARADAAAGEPELRLITNWRAAPPGSATTAEEWIEKSARSIPYWSWPVAGCESRILARERRVPSADAARDDRCLTRRQVIDYTVDAGQPMHPDDWGRLWQAGHTPAPRHLALGGSMPLWHVDDVAAYLAHGSHQRSDGRRCRDCAEIVPPDAGSRCESCRVARLQPSRERHTAIAAAVMPPPMREQLLARVAAGEHLTDVCADLGVSQQRVHGWRHRDDTWSERLDAALMAGRDPDLDHGTHQAYRHGRCRCPECREARARQAP